MKDLGGCLKALEKEALKRELHPWRNEGLYARDKNGRYLNFSSNDYLGLTLNKSVIGASVAALKKYGSGSTSSRLVCGHSELYAKAEKDLASFKRTRAALVFNSGYTANLGIINSFLQKGDTVFFDRLSHASIIDAVMLSGVKWKSFPHNDLKALGKMLERYSVRGRGMIITESVFSMDGDLAPLKELKDLAEKYDFYLYVDEAHASGVFGKNMEGLSTAAGLQRSDKVLLMGTLGKALGNFGAYFAGTYEQSEYLVNQARPLIFSTALPPAVLGGVRGALKYIRQHPGKGGEVLAKAGRFREMLKDRGIPQLPGVSQIVPVITGSNEKTLALSSWLKKNKILAAPIRPPTVKPGTGRIRFALNVFHQDKHLHQTADLIAQFWEQQGL